MTRTSEGFWSRTIRESTPRTTRQSTVTKDLDQVERITSPQTTSGRKLIYSPSSLHMVSPASPTRRPATGWVLRGASASTWPYAAGVLWSFVGMLCRVTLGDGIYTNQNELRKFSH
ncbi:unnamed protein product [Boreogadus saida]